MKLIGITGKSGSGKSTLANCLSNKLNCLYVDTDKVCHEALNNKEIIEKLKVIFGLDIFDRNTQNINRKLLGKIVFKDSNKMKMLTNITWAYLENFIDNIILQNPKYLIIEGIAINQTKYWDKFSYKILVSSDDLMRKENVIKRDNISAEYFDIRDLASIDYSNLSFDYIFHNNYREDTLTNFADKVINTL